MSNLKFTTKSLYQWLTEITLSSESDECLLWPYSRNAQGYGQIKPPNVNKPVLVHRLAYEIKHGPIPQGLEVCHSCDIPPCFNVRHLFKGTHAENMADMRSKNRQPLGESRKGTKLTQNDVAEIRALYASGDFTTYELGNKFHVSQGHISMLINLKIRVRG